MAVCIVFWQYTAQSWQWHSNNSLSLLHSSTFSQWPLDMYVVAWGPGITYCSGGPSPGPPSLCYVGRGPTTAWHLISGRRAPRGWLFFFFQRPPASIPFSGAGPAGHLNRFRGYFRRSFDRRRRPRSCAWNEQNKGILIWSRVYYLPLC